MNARLASETRTIMLGAHPVVLVPSLRAAHTLADRFDGYHTLVVKIGQGDTAAIAATIDAGTNGTDALPLVLAEIEAKGVLRALTPLQATLARFVESLTGPSDEPTDEKPKDTPKGEAPKPVSFVEFHEGLFEIATGELGWTPRDAWAATPTEIIAARKGRVALIENVLTAVFGKPDETTNPKASESLPLDQKVKAVFANLGTTVIRRPKPDAN